MSFQRILEQARRRGLPVIVTDLAGRDPLVILPLEEYERLSVGDSTAPTESSPLQAHSPPHSSDALTTEERFYLEPVDEAQD